MLSNRTKTKLCSGLFLLALIFVAFLGAYSGKPQSQQQTPNASPGASIKVQQAGEDAAPSSLPEGNGEQPDRTSEKPSDEISSWDDFWNPTVTEVLLAAFTALLVLVGGLQTKILHRTNQQAAAIERAYVLARVEMAGLEHAHSGFLRITVRVTFINHGRTPALLKRLRGHLHRSELRDGAPTSLFDLPFITDMPPGLAIGAGEPWAREFSQIVSRDEWENVKAKTENLFCVGMIAYNDVLGKQCHETGFCWEYQLRGTESMFEIAPSKLNYQT